MFLNTGNHLGLQEDTHYCPNARCWCVNCQFICMQNALRPLSFWKVGALRPLSFWKVGVLRPSSFCSDHSHRPLTGYRFCIWVLQTHGQVWHGMICYGLPWSGMAWNPLLWFAMVWSLRILGTCLQICWQLTQQQVWDKLTCLYAYILSSYMGQKL